MIIIHRWTGLLPGQRQGDVAHSKRLQNSKSALFCCSSSNRSAGTRREMLHTWTLYGVAIHMMMSDKDEGDSIGVLNVYF